MPVPTPAVVVVGAGLVGSAVAWELASRGAAVSVFDAREPGYGATQASAGMLAPFTEVRASGPFESLCIEGLEVYDDQGHAVVAEKGELVCTAPFPSMPVGFWNDPEGKKYEAVFRIDKSPSFDS